MLIVHVCMSTWPSLIWFLSCSIFLFVFLASLLLISVLSHNCNIPWSSMLPPLLLFFEEPHGYSSLSLYLYLCNVSSNIYISNVNHPIIALEPTTSWDHLHLPPTSSRSRTTNSIFMDFNILPSISFFSSHVLCMNWWHNPPKMSLLLILHHS